MRVCPCVHGCTCVCVCMCACVLAHGNIDGVSICACVCMAFSMAGACNITCIAHACAHGCTHAHLCFSCVPEWRCCDCFLNAQKPGLRQQPRRKCTLTFCEGMRRTFLHFGGYQLRASRTKFYGGKTDGLSNPLNSPPWYIRYF